jgi:selenide,water dikinase
LKQKPQGNVVVGFDTSDDAGVYRLSDELCLIQTADFITPIGNDPFLFGQVAAANSLSDIYAMGGKPISALNLCCFPPRGIDKQFLSEILRGGMDILQKAGAALLGGHTIRDDELKYGLAANGLVRLSEVKRNSSAKAGDKIILTKPIGTGVIIHAIKLKVLEEAALAEIAPFMVQLNHTACDLMQKYQANACTDISGFGLLGHAWETALASGVGLRLYADSIPHFPNSLEMIRKDVKIGMNAANRDFLGDKVSFAEGISEEFRKLLCDPQTSGGLFIILPALKADTLLRSLHQEGMKAAAIIGEIFESEPRIEVLAK